MSLSPISTRFFWPSLQLVNEPGLGAQEMQAWQVASLCSPVGPIGQRQRSCPPKTEVVALHALRLLPSDGGLTHLRGTVGAAVWLRLASLRREAGWERQLEQRLSSRRSQASRAKKDARIQSRAVLLALHRSGSHSRPAARQGHSLLAQRRPTCRAARGSRRGSSWREAACSLNHHTLDAPLSCNCRCPALKPCRVAPGPCRPLQPPALLTDLHTQPGKRLPHLAGSQPQNCTADSEVWHSNHGSAQQRRRLQRGVRCHMLSAVELHKQSRRDQCGAHLFAEVGVTGAGAVGAAHPDAAAGKVLRPHLQASASRCNG